MNDNASLALGGNRSGLGGLPQRLVQDGVVEEAAMLTASRRLKIAASFVTQLTRPAPPRRGTSPSPPRRRISAFRCTTRSHNVDPTSSSWSRTLFKHACRCMPRQASVLGVADPTNLHAIDEIKFQTGMGIEAVVVGRQAAETHRQGREQAERRRYRSSPTMRAASISRTRRQRWRRGHGRGVSRDDIRTRPSCASA